MSTTRAEAMAALRHWSAPGRRAELIATAWDAGETNISALAEAARVSRPTVYADLRSRGIDPDRRPAKESTMQISPVTLEGFTGLNLDGNEPRQFMDAVHRFIDEHPDASPGVEHSRLLALMDTLRDYNTLRPRLMEEQVAREERDRALHLVETRWEALSNAANWLAAHHAYVVAVDDAGIAIDMWKDRAADAVKVPFNQDTETRRAAYEQILTSGHPPVEPLTISPDDVAEQLHTALDQAHARRRRIAAETLGLGQSASR
ncbi:hypothetical protein ACH4PU_30460 [Streptomyces sp. NPDC021100]|uniref:hypothetical protein n=1 Tax=Streptomyces sp. NPDC021100 TaxID=3365114 RepID=UPI003793135E